MKKKNREGRQENSSSSSLAHRWKTFSQEEEKEKKEKSHRSALEWRLEGREDQEKESNSATDGGKSKLY
jgi:hypothetical protein